jgi:hypothetical protein
VCFVSILIQCSSLWFVGGITLLSLSAQRTAKGGLSKVAPLSFEATPGLIATRRLLILGLAFPSARQLGCVCFVDWQRCCRYVVRWRVRPKCYGIVWAVSFYWLAWSLKPLRFCAQVHRYLLILRWWANSFVSSCQLSLITHWQVGSRFNWTEARLDGQFSHFVTPFVKISLFYRRYVKRPAAVCIVACNFQVAAPGGSPSTRIYRAIYRRINRARWRLGCALFFASTCISTLLSHFSLRMVIFVLNERPNAVRWNWILKLDVRTAHTCLQALLQVCSRFRHQIVACNGFMSWPAFI